MYTKSFLCQHGSLIKPDSLMTPDQCRTCRISLGIDKPQDRKPVSAKSKPSNDDEPCLYRGDKLPVNKKAPLQVWYECDHKTKPLGSKVCSCTGCGSGCIGYVPESSHLDLPTPNWAYGITTVPDRRDNYLLRCLESLTNAGFDKPTLFIDNCQDVRSWEVEFNLPIVPRMNGYVGAYRNWLLALAHLYLNNPQADRYAIFQDDAVVCKGARSYIDTTIPTFPRKCYLSMYTAKSNEIFLEQQGHKSTGWYKSTQRGRGAVALVFNQDAVKFLLKHPDVWEHVHNERKGHKNIDGIVCDCLTPAGFVEYVHNPSLVEHIGMESTIGNSAGRHKIKLLTEAPTV